MEHGCDRFGEASGKLQWVLTPWVNWGVVHSAYFACRFGGLYIFSAVFPRNTRTNRSTGITKTRYAVSAFCDHASRVLE